MPWLYFPFSAPSANSNVIDFGLVVGSSVTFFTAVPEYQPPSEGEVLARAKVVSFAEHEQNSKQLAERIQARLRIFKDAAGSRPIRLFVNVGGAASNFGAGEESLKLPNGLVRKAPVLPATPTRGLAFEFLARGVPIVHLLHVKGLARDNGLPFDPVPFPPVGRGEVYGERRRVKR